MWLVFGFVLCGRRFLVHLGALLSSSNRNIRKIAIFGIFLSLICAIASSPALHIKKIAIFWIFLSICATTSSGLQDCNLCDITSRRLSLCEVDLVLLFFPSYAHSLYPFLLYHPQQPWVSAQSILSFQPHSHYRDLYVPCTEVPLKSTCRLASHPYHQLHWLSLAA